MVLDFVSSSWAPMITVDSSESMIALLCGSLGPCPFKFEEKLSSPRRRNSSVRFLVSRNRLSSRRCFTRRILSSSSSPQSFPVIELSNSSLLSLRIVDFHCSINQATDIFSRVFVVASCAATIVPDRSFTSKARPSVLKVVFCCSVGVITIRVA